MRSHAWRFGNPKGGTSPIHSDAFFLSLHFCGIWWSLRIMFPTLGLFFIEFNLHLRKRGKRKLEDYDQRLSFASSSRIAFVHTSDDRKPISNAAFLFTKLQSMQLAIAVIWHCRRCCFFSFHRERLRNCDIFIVSQLWVFFSASHGEWLHAFMASDYASVLPFNVV